ncbi:MAG: hypothetical protein ACYTG6_07675 [Planctomycetota bacterium]|jgi:hypothetical protein
MGEGSSPGTWRREGPTTSAYYEVRPCLEAWNLGLESPQVPPAARLTYVDVSTGCFDAKTFGGDISEPLWEWRGPIQVPHALPETL